MKNFLNLFQFFLAISSLTAFAEEQPKVKVRYKEGATMKFNPTDIHGSWKEPDTMMVNGDSAKGMFDLLSLRQNFFDREMEDLGMEIPAPVNKETKK